MAGSFHCGIDPSGFLKDRKFVCLSEELPISLSTRTVLNGVSETGKIGYDAIRENWVYNVHEIPFILAELLTKILIEND